MTIETPHRQLTDPWAQFAYRTPDHADAVVMHGLVQASPPLDLNSIYAYLLVCTHFASTSVVAEQQDKLAGFISGYIKPAEPTALFIWQVAVHPRARRRGLGLQMLAEILARPACHQVRYLETTITPSNNPSRRLFQHLAARLQSPIDVSPLFTVQDLGTGHEEERLVRIGPFAPNAPGDS